jgi:hypothetical protein
LPFPGCLLILGANDRAFAKSRTARIDAALALNTTVIAQAPPGSLWYNGDFDRINALDNEENTVITQAAVYDDFNVTAPMGVACDGRLL